MEIKLITENKKVFLDLLLLADEQENMIDKYLERGDLFALYDGDLKSVCVVTEERNGTFEVQNLATYEKYHRQGYASKLMRHIFDYYKGQGRTMIVGTGDVPNTMGFYESRGFVFSHKIKDYFIEHYDHPMFENGIQLRDKVYLVKNL